MLYVVQNNLYNEYGYNQLMETLERFSLPYVIVKPVPFAMHLLPADFDTDSYTGDITKVPEPVIDTSGHVIVLGATTLTKIATTRNWVPGSFINENFDYSKWRDAYGDNLLNYDAKVCAFKDVDDSFPSFFIRPCEDTKSFSGTVMTYEDFDSWRKDLSTADTTHSPLTMDTMVSYAPPKDIMREYRFFVVDGKVITGSQYKAGSRVYSDTNVDQDIIDYAQSMVNMWQPARAFVIDIALIPGNQKKVIEINNINSAGFYACDVSKIIQAFEAMTF